MTTISVIVTGTDEAVKRLELIASVQTKAIRSALNDSGTAAFTALSKAVRSKWNIKAGNKPRGGGLAIGFKQAVKKPSRATLAKPEYSMQVDNISVPLLFFAAKDEYPRGVSYKILNKGGKGRIKHGFINTSKSRHRPYVLVRESKHRYPLRPLASIGVVSMIEDTEANNAWAKAVLERFPARYWHHLKYFSKHKK